MEENEFYTYAYLREDRTPYYVGKGKGKRYLKEHCCPVPSEDRILFLKTGLTEQEAHRHEIYMIAVFGRKDIGTGILRNLTDGGEGQTGLVHRKESKEKMSIAHRCRAEHLNNHLKDFTDRCPDHQKKAFARLLELNPDHQSKAGKLGGSVRASQDSFKEMSSDNLVKMNNTFWEDPDHPELGYHRASHLVRKQKKLGYPHGKENRIQVSIPKNNV
jgi:hypothetical protein